MDAEGFKLIIDVVCAATTDQNTLATAEWATMRTGGHASTFLHRYLDGRGGNEYIDINTLFREDPALLKTTQEKIIADLRAKPSKESGTIPLPQRVFSNQDWRYAIGSLNLDWRLVTWNANSTTPEVELSFKNKYRWHPNEPRVTQCIHQAAERLKTSGAADFWMIGRPVRIKITADYR
jgi:hypothetical protein